ncbi:DUF533 domain-containing protein [Vitreoscilla massiliensis]|uniref:DUF533 domain-containing protein n=1 Tax=Vitreoscilla massiliensis TaxID=1689272 RepID=A0ABY4E3F7_9NEIS|nr:DUF533 domain-containing protein [Vitreoscilla massiliensis]UOO90047.1 DUF533 domain-containing protein [Vitreoscilla massiliensis]
MSDTENQAIMTVAVMAAFADGSKHSSERNELSAIASSLGLDNKVQLLQIDQAVLRQQTLLSEVAADISDAGSKQLAYEIAVGVCGADGSISEAEQAFLSRLAQALQLPETPINTTTPSHAIAQTELNSANQQGFEQGLNHVALDTAALSAAAPKALVAIDSQLEATLNSRILKTAIINGALELLPQTAASMAIIPLQMRLVYGIGKDLGYDLDQGHIKDLLATVGIGMTSQYLEQAGIKLLGTVLGSLRSSLGGKLGKSLTGMVGKVGNQAISSGMSFATTYALGHVAKEYYASGRQFSPQVLKDAYARLMQDGISLQPQYSSDIQQQAKTLDLNKIMQMVKGQ